jgi:hypothetical protein
MHRLPPGVLPVLYLGTAHVSLALACLLVAWWPHAVAGFFYHSWMVAIVHLVTLGWITFSIFGAIYIAGPTTLGMRLPARFADYVAYAFALIGVVGMVAHFWIQEFGGMAWSAATLTLAIVYMAVRILVALRRASAPLAVKLHIALACVNFVAAAAVGVTLGFDKVRHFLPGFVLTNVIAHAHLAALGWATMMVIGVGYRLIPMVLWAKPPSGRGLFTTAALLETGVILLFHGLILRNVLAPAGGLLVVGGLASVAAQLGRLLGNRRSKPAGAPDVDFAACHAAAAGVCLAIATVLGLYVLFAPPSETSLRVAIAYGSFGLVGFLAQMVVAMEARLLPLFAWYGEFEANGLRGPVMSPQVMHNQLLQQIVFIGWVFGVPAVSVGLAAGAANLISAGACAMLTAVVAATIDNTFVVSHAWRSGNAASRAA